MCSGRQRTILSACGGIGHNSKRFAKLARNVEQLASCAASILTRMGFIASLGVIEQIQKSGQLVGLAVTSLRGQMRRQRRRLPLSTNGG
eukprot:479875-Karenia_brevis.AAC.1